MANPIAGRILAAASACFNKPIPIVFRQAVLVRRAFDRVRVQAAEADPDKLPVSFPGAAGAPRVRPLWGVVLSVSAFDNLFAGRVLSVPEPNRDTPDHPAHSTKVAGLLKIEGGENRSYNNIFIGDGAAADYFGKTRNETNPLARSV